MYQPAAFAEVRLDVMHSLIRACPLGMLVLPGPTADLVPFMLYPDEGGQGVLRAHIARANPAVQALADGAECLVVFQGPQAYVSPGWYASKGATHKVVPTWNYAMVQVRGTARLMEDGAWLLRQIGDLTAQQERAMAEPWSVADAPPDFIDGMLRAIVGIELPIASITGKWKVSQNRSAADMAGVLAGLQEQGAAGMAALVEGRLKRD